jgi:hypothetical protein
MLFGYRTEENFDFAKEQRRDRFKWVVGGGLFLQLVFYFIHPFSAVITQAYLITFMSYGDSFYVRRRDDLAKDWLWKAIIATVPLHLLFLGVIVLSDGAFPNLVPKPLFYFPALLLTFGIEAVLFDCIVDRFRPACAVQPVDVKQL